MPSYPRSPWCIKAQNQRQYSRTEKRQDTDEGNRRQSRTIGFHRRGDHTIINPHQVIMYCFHTRALDGFVIYAVAMKLPNERHTPIAERCSPLNNLCSNLTM